MLGMRRLSCFHGKWSKQLQLALGTQQQPLPPSECAITLPNRMLLQQHALTRRKCVKASQLSNMRSPIRRNVSCSSRPARAFNPKALSAMRSNA